MCFHLCHDFFRLLGHSVHWGLNFHIPGSIIYYCRPKFGTVGFSGCVARGPAPPIKTTLPKGESMGLIVGLKTKRINNQSESPDKQTDAHRTNDRDPSEKRFHNFCEQLECRTHTPEEKKPEYLWQFLATLW